jgi:hypothetical protein
MNGASPSNWTNALRRRIELLHQQIAAMQRLVQESGGNEEMLARSCQSYYMLLEDIYDLLLHLDGEGLQTESPRLSLVTGIISDVRKQVGTMIKTLVSTLNEGVELPKEIDLGLSSFASGSLYLGFSLPEPKAGYVAIEGDPLFAASRQALATLGSVTRHINQPNAYELIRREFADPKLRDAALSAVGQLAPSGRRGVSSVDIAGRALQQQGGWRHLTPETRERVRAWLEQPVLGSEIVELRGRVRAVDLDLRRFDLRRIGGSNQPDLRCIYPAAFDVPAKGWLDATVVVRGQVETYQGAPRLVQVQRVDIVEESVGA